MLEPSSKPNAALIELIKSTNLADLGDVFAALREKTAEYREGHGGYVPLNIFPEVLGIAGHYTSLEYVLRVTDEGKPMGYLMRKREADEHGWQGQFHIVGVAFVNQPENGVMERARTRVEKEIPFIDWRSEREKLLPICLESHPEPERYSACISIVMCYDIPYDRYLTMQLPINWELVSAENPTQPLVPHHRDLLNYMNGHLGTFELIDLKPGT